MTALVLLTLVHVLCSLNQATSQTVYHITANLTDLCTVQPCLTLSQFAANTSQYLHSNTTLVFLPGTHYLSKVNLTLSNVVNVAMKAENSLPQINCTTNESYINFSDLQCMHISNLEFIGCGGNLVKHVEKFVVENTIFKGQENSGTALILIETNTQIINCSFVSNRKGSYHTGLRALVGGAIIASNSTICISQSKFNSNAASYAGGAIYAEQWSILNMSGNVFSNNHVAQGIGGALYSTSNTRITIEASEFHHNSGFKHEGVVNSRDSNITVKTSKFQDNNVNDYGGILKLLNSTISIETSEFLSNSGGVLVSYDSTITIGCSNFTKNRSKTGTVIVGSKITCHGYLLFDNNSVDSYAVIYLIDSQFRVNDSMETFTFSNNLGSFMAFNSNITFSGYALFMKNQPASLKPRYNIQEGGAITLFQSSVFFDGECNLKHNHADYGGAIYSTESKLYVNGNVTLAHNTATRNGGGVYLSGSELNCQRNSTFTLFNNTAVHKGGGLHAIRSSIKATSDIDLGMAQYSGTRIYFTKNVAWFGGGLSLEANAKLYILKHSKVEVWLNNYLDTNATIFTANSAEYGGAVYVDDDTNSGCSSDPKTECFFQVLAMYIYIIDVGYIPDLVSQSMYFSKNYANISGSTLYGGLLDRCAPNPYAERNYTGSFAGITYFKNISTFNHNIISIFSKPVRVCLCTKNLSVNIHPCSIHQNRFDVKKGETFTVSLVAVDQIFQPLNATIQASVLYTDSRLAEGQLNTISAQCTNLTFNIVSLHDSENLTLYASDGPCKDAELSTATVEVHFLPCSCPIGLQVAGTNDSNCTCECHRKISLYMKKCNSQTGSLVKQPRSRAWISFINDTDLDLTGYLVYPNCPFDYCLSTSPPIYLNKPNGADAQCAFNRSSLLCGSCQPGLSLSLGSSLCLSCPRKWPVLPVTITLAAVLAGIALVALLLVLNMTVAIGTLNGLIFYTNIVYANKSILLPFQETNFITVFISWLNLELGIDTCYFPGMNTYIKTWLKLVFPAYVFLLVVLIIIISSYSTRFSNLIGKKNPVATLATLILLSYAKLVEICFQSLSIGILEYPAGGSRKMLWLPDATVKYLSGKHIPLFFTTVLILLVGLVYTALLFLWQWLLYLPKWRIFNWSRNPKVQTFIETYNTPYTPKYRYWTGLLLIARVALYLTAAANVSNNPTIALTSIFFVVGFIFCVKGFTSGKQYRMWSKDVLETFFHLNILIFATMKWYSLDNENKYQEAIAYTSVTITIILLLLIILYHLYTYTSLFSRVKETKLGRRMDQLFTDSDPKPQPRVRQLTPPTDDDINRFDDRNLLDDLDVPVYTGDYETAPLINSVRIQPTYSVVEVHQPCHHALPPPKQSNNAQNMPADSN